MNFPGIYASIIGLAIATIASIIGIYDGDNKIGSIYLFLVVSIGAVISLIGIYLQWKESETIRIKVQFEKEGQSDFYVFKIPYNLYRKKHPIISMVDSNYAFCWGFPSETMADGTIIFRTTDMSLDSDRYILIK